MTIEVDDGRRAYAGDGVQVDFGTPPYIDDSEVRITLVRADGSRVACSLGTHFLLSRTVAPGPGTATVISSTVIPQIGETLLVTTEPAILQPDALASGGPFPAETVESGLDRRTVVEQYLARLQRASLRAPPNDLISNMELPVDALRANRVQAYTAAGAPSLLTYAELGALIGTLPGDGNGDGGTAVNVTTLYRDDLGLVGDGITDDSIVLNKKIAEWSGKGGAIFDLRPKDGASFRFANPVRIQSGVHVLFSGGPQRLTKNARITLSGGVAETPTVNKPRLLEAVTLGATTARIDMAPQGGVAVSSLFPVGARAILRGSHDAAGNIVEKDVVRITAVNDSTRTITFTPATAFAYQVSYPNDAYELNFGVPDASDIVRIVDAPLASDGTEGLDYVTVTSGGFALLAVGHLVELSDEKLSSDVSVGGSANPVHVEMLRVVALGEQGANTVSFDRRLERTYETAYAARLTVQDPCIGASLSGASIVFTEAPDQSPAARVHTLHLDRAFNCRISGCQVLNEDSFGSRGNAIRAESCLDCIVDDCYVANPKWRDSGDGYGFADYYSTRTLWRNNRATGCRHNFIGQGSTLGRLVSCVSANDWLSGFDFHGLDEVGCAVIGCIATGGTHSAASTRTALKLGNTAHRVGPRRCIALDLHVTSYTGASSRAVQAEPGAQRCGVHGLRCSTIETVLYFSDNSGASTLTASDIALEEVVVDGCAGTLVDVDGGRNGSSTRTLVRLTLRDIRSKGAPRGILLRQVAGADLIDLWLDAGTIDGSAPYKVAAVDVTGLWISDCTFRAGRRGIALTTCPSAVVVDNRFAGQDQQVVLMDGDGNTDARWVDNVAVDFDGTKDTPGGSSTGLVEYPLPIGSIGDLLTTR